MYSINIIYRIAIAGITLLAITAISATATADSMELVIVSAMSQPAKADLYELNATPSAQVLASEYSRQLLSELNQRLSEENINSTISTDPHALYRQNLHVDLNRRLATQMERLRAQVNP